MRSVDMQIWPWFMKALKAAARTASSRSASSSTTNGALPPSSSSTGFRWRAAISAISRPDAGGAGEVDAPHHRVGDQRLDDGGPRPSARW